MSITFLAILTEQQNDSVEESLVTVDTNQADISEEYVGVDKRTYATCVTNDGYMTELCLYKSLLTLKVFLHRKVELIVEIGLSPRSDGSFGGSLRRKMEAKGIECVGPFGPAITNLAEKLGVSVNYQD